MRTWLWWFLLRTRLRQPRTFWETLIWHGWIAEDHEDRLVFINSRLKQK